MLEARSALQSVARPGRYGAMRPEGPGVVLTEIRDRQITQLAGWPDGFATVLDRLSGLIDKGCPVMTAGTERVWVVGGVVGTADRLRDALPAGQAVVLDLSHARTVVAVEGPQVRRVLAKGFPIDLHADAFPEGAAAQTAVDHVGVLVHRTGPDRFEIYVPRSFAAGFWRWLTESAAEVGYEVSPAISGARRIDALKQ